MDEESWQQRLPPEIAMLTSSCCSASVMKSRVAESTRLLAVQRAMSEQEGLPGVISLVTRPVVGRSLPKETTKRP